MDLPITKYHPNPVATGSVEANPDQPCLCCNRIRGYVYTGPAYAERFHYLSACLCPWCVADGSAAKAFGAEFTDTGTLDDVPKAVLEELVKRTPGFTAWQQEQWLCCCQDAAAYLGRAGAAELAGEWAWEKTVNRRPTCFAVFTARRSWPIATRLRQEPRRRWRLSGRQSSKTAGCGLRRSGCRWR